MPRSGNTLFASLMNQNPDIAVTANSITLEIMKELFLLKQDDTFKNFPDEQSLNNVMNKVYNLYYEHWYYKVIIDRGPVCTPGNLKVMQKHFKQPIRCIVLVRDLLDVLASYIKWFETEPTAFPNQYTTLDEKLSQIMRKNGAVAKGLISIQYLLKHPEIAVFVKYDNLVAQSEQEFRKIYQFIDEPYFNHRFYNLDQVYINGLSYNDTIVGSNMHKLFDGPVRKVHNPYIEKIPQRIREKYGHIRF